MTDFKRAKFSKTKKGLVTWQGFFGVFFTLVLSFAIINGLLNKKSSSDTKSESYRWDGISSLGIVINGSEDFLAIFQREPKRAVLFSLGQKFDEGINPDQMIKDVSSQTGVTIKNYIISGISENDLKSFSSFSTPFKIIAGNGDMNTNISRIDGLRLWWQAKNIRPNEVSSANLSSEQDANVLGANSYQANREVKPFFENINIIDEDIDISLISNSDDPETLTLFKMFIESVGGRVVDVDVEEDEGLVSFCTVIGADSYTRNYLAKTFDCAINDGTLEESRLTIIVGQDFTESYF